MKKLRVGHAPRHFDVELYSLLNYDEVSHGINHQVPA